jgi:hypothetical protein
VLDKQEKNIIAVTDGDPMVLKIPIKEDGSTGEPQVLQPHGILPIRWRRSGHKRQYLCFGDCAKRNLGPFPRRLATHTDSQQDERSAGQQHQHGF